MQRLMRGDNRDVQEGASDIELGVSWNAKVVQVTFIILCPQDSINAFLEVSAGGFGIRGQVPNWTHSPGLGSQVRHNAKTFAVTVAPH